METNVPCPTCGSVGFEPSVLGADRCSFCDGSEAGLCPYCTKVHDAERPCREQQAMEGAYVDGRD